MQTQNTGNIQQDQTLPHSLGSILSIIESRPGFGNHTGYSPVNASIGSDTLPIVNLLPEISISRFRVAAQLNSGDEHHNKHLKLNEQVILLENLNKWVCSIDKNWNKVEWPDDVSLFDMISAHVKALNRWAEAKGVDLTLSGELWKSKKTHLFAVTESGDCLAKIPHGDFLRYLEDVDKPLWTILGACLGKMAIRKGCSLWDNGMTMDDLETRMFEAYQELENVDAEYDEIMLMPKHARAKLLLNEDTVLDVLAEAIHHRKKVINPYASKIVKLGRSISDVKLRGLVRKYPWHRRYFLKRLLVWVRQTEKVLKASGVEVDFMRREIEYSDRDVIYPAGYQFWTWTTGRRDFGSESEEERMQAIFENYEMIGHKKIWKFPLKPGDRVAPIKDGDFPVEYDRWFSYSCFCFAEDSPALYKGYWGKKGKDYLKKIEKKYYGD